MWWKMGMVEYLPMEFVSFSRLRIKPICLPYLVSCLCQEELFSVGEWRRCWISVEPAPPLWGMDYSTGCTKRPS
jgi:hypothetical protein